MKIAAFLLGIAGAVLFTVLLIQQGIKEVGGLIATAGWGLLVVAAFHFVPMFADVVAWWKLFPAEGRPPLRRLTWMRWVSESVNNLLPTGQVGGDIVRARLATLSGVPLPTAVASVVVEITVGIFTQALFTLLGVFLLVVVTGGTNLMRPLLAGLALAVLMILGFFAVQRIGLFKLLGLLVTKLVDAPAWHDLAKNGHALDDAIQRVYQQRRDVLASCVWTLISWLVGAGEMWLGLYLLGMRPDFIDALILESVGQGMRSAMFLVPGAIGLQEGGLLLIGSLLGIPADVAFALSLIRRVRDITLGLPGLLVWQWIEGRRLWKRRVAPAAGTERNASNPSSD